MDCAETATEQEIYRFVRKASTVNLEMTTEERIYAHATVPIATQSNTKGNCDFFVREVREGENAQNLYCFVRLLQSRNQYQKNDGFRTSCN